MKMRLRVVELATHLKAKENGRSTRDNEVMKTWNIPPDTSVVGTEIRIRGVDYFVLDQYPSRKAMNAAKKHMEPMRYRKWTLGLR